MKVNSMFWLRQFITGFFVIGILLSDSPINEGKLIVLVRNFSPRIICYWHSVKQFTNEGNFSVLVRTFSLKIICYWHSTVATGYYVTFGGSFRVITLATSLYKECGN